MTFSGDRTHAGESTPPQSENRVADGSSDNQSTPDELPEEISWAKDRLNTIYRREISEGDDLDVLSEEFTVAFESLLEDCRTRIQSSAEQFVGACAVLAQLLSERALRQDVDALTDVVNSVLSRIPDRVEITVHSTRSAPTPCKAEEATR